MSRAQLANLAKSNPIVAERLAAGHYEEQEASPAGLLDQQTLTEELIEELQAAPELGRAVALELGEPLLECIAETPDARDGLARLVVDRLAERPDLCDELARLVVDRLARSDLAQTRLDALAGGVAEPEDAAADHEPPDAHEARRPGFLDGLRGG